MRADAEGTRLVLGIEMPYNLVAQHAVFFHQAADEVRMLVYLELAELFFAYAFFHVSHHSQAEKLMRFDWCRHSCGAGS